MIDLIERPSITTGGDLPPILQHPRPRRDDEPIIIPDVCFIQDQHKIYDHENNDITIVYFHMHRVWGFYDRCQYAHSQSRRYRSWLETDREYMKSGIPPHIQWGGCIKTLRELGLPPLAPGQLDFHEQWKIRTRKKFF